MGKNVDSEFAEPISLPADFAPAVMAGRVELLKAIAKNRTLNAEETQAVVHALAVMMKTNMGLRDQVGRLSERLEEIDGIVAESVPAIRRLADGIARAAKRKDNAG